MLQFLMFGFSEEDLTTIKTYSVVLGGGVFIMYSLFIAKKKNFKRWYSQIRLGQKNYSPHKS